MTDNAKSRMIKKYAEKFYQEDRISQELFEEYNVKRGLRDINGKGVVAGLTSISKIISSKDVNGKSVPCDGR